MNKETKKVVAGSFIEILLEVEKNIKEGWQIDEFDYPIFLGSYFETVMIRYVPEEIDENVQESTISEPEATEDSFLSEPVVSESPPKQRKPYTKKS